MHSERLKLIVIGVALAVASILLPGCATSQRGAEIAARPEFEDRPVVRTLIRKNLFLPTEDWTAEEWAGERGKASRLAVKQSKRKTFD